MLTFDPAVGAFGKGLRTSLTFVSQAALDDPAVHGLGLARPLEPLRGTSGIGKANMGHNGDRARIDVDPEAYEVHADGELPVCEPATVLTLAQR